MDTVNETGVRLEERAGKVFHAYRAAGHRVGTVRRSDILSGEISITVPGRLFPPRRARQVKVSLSSNGDTSTTVRVSPASKREKLPRSVTDILTRFANEELSSLGKA